MTQGAVSKIINKALRAWAENEGATSRWSAPRSSLSLISSRRRSGLGHSRASLLPSVRPSKIIQAQSKISGADAPVRVERHTTVELDLDAREIERMEDAWLHSGGEVIDAVVSDDATS
jgi:hypothetical protein